MVIDDFGGAPLAVVPAAVSVDYLKVDRGFVSAIESADGEAPILDAIIDRASRRPAARAWPKGGEPHPARLSQRARGGLCAGLAPASRPMPSKDLALAGWAAGAAAPPGA